MQIGRSLAAKVAGAGTGRSITFLDGYTIFEDPYLVGVLIRLGTLLKSESGNAYSEAEIGERVGHMIGMIKTAVLGALLSVVALGYYLRVLVVLYMQPPPEGETPPTTQRPLTAGLATVVCVAFVLAMGLAPAWFLDQLG